MREKKKKKESTSRVLYRSKAFKLELKIIWGFFRTNHFDRPPFFFSSFSKTKKSFVPLRFFFFSKTRQDPRRKTIDPLLLPPISSSFSLFQRGGGPEFCFKSFSEKRLIRLTGQSTTPKTNACSTLVLLNQKFAFFRGR